MTFTSSLLFLAILAPAPPQSVPLPNCASSTTNTAAVQMCVGEQELSAAGTAKTPPERERHLRAALAAYRRAADATSDTATKTRALDAVTGVLDRANLNLPTDLELTLRELVAIAPSDASFMFRLAKVQEDQGQTDAAEDTLLTAHRQQPRELAPYKMLAQFYARRATAISNEIAQAKGPSPSATDIPGTPDKDGVYRVGGGVPPPQRADIPRYPEEAKAAGIDGAVLAEVVVNELGAVSDVKIVRSVPMLDEAALETVKQWRFRPSVVNGHPVPTRMVVTVTFAQ